MITLESPPLALGKKLAAVLSEKIEPGVAMNALAHMSLGLGAALGPAESLMCDYRDADGISHPFISAYPFIILRGRPGKIREAVEVAKAAGVHTVGFTSTMTVGTYGEQLKRTSETRNADLEFYGAAFYGDTAAVSDITRKFSLFR